MLAAKADYKLQWGTLHEKKYLPLKKRHAALEQCDCRLISPVACHCMIVGRLMLHVSPLDLSIISCVLLLSSFSRLDMC